jgi:hypothetical protein
MSAKKTNDKLAEITEVIAVSLDNSALVPAGDYEYSASYHGPRTSRLAGIWTVLDHTVGGVPYPEYFAAHTFRDNPPAHLDYHATYEFTHNLCIKRVMLHGDIPVDGEKASYDYRMNVVLTWDISRESLNVQPVLGYQYSSLDGQPTAVRDLPSTGERIQIGFRFEDGMLILEDGNDIKKLQRTES